MPDETQTGFTPPPASESPESPTSPAEADRAAGDAFAERPELYVGAAFAGGVAVAGLLRFLSR
jgi:hypothetical protein